MNYLSQLTENEIRYVCSVIPFKHVSSYFKQYPKDFSTIKKGFRSTSVKNQEQASELLFTHHDKRFISSFLEDHISRWIDEIKKIIAIKVNDGDSKETAFLRTLPFCFFADNIALYLKLAGEKLPDEYAELLSVAIKTIKESDIKLNEIEATLGDKDIVIDRQKNTIETIHTELDKCSAEIKVLMHSKIDLEKLEATIQSSEKVKKDLESKAQEREEYIEQLKAELSDIKENYAELEKQGAIKKFNNINSIKKPLCPKDMNDFKDYLGYNLENIGISTNEDYWHILKEHLCNILFQGLPIVINRNAGMCLIKCVANTLMDTPNAEILAFSDDISEQTINDFLLNSGRIVCLDNFIGNFNETILLALCDYYKDTIIFLTVFYDRTLYFLADEFFKYCNYLNLDRIDAFASNSELDEDPSSFEEIEIAATQVVRDWRWSKLLQEMLGELGFNKSIALHKSAIISDEQSLCCSLVFDILPFCVHILRLLPFNVSEQLVNYIGNNGKCSYKNLLHRWFA